MQGELIAACTAADETDVAKSARVTNSSEFRIRNNFISMHTIKRAAKKNDAEDALIALAEIDKKVE